MLVDQARGRAYYLAFDLILAEAPIVDGRVDLRKGNVIRSEEPVFASWLSAVRARLLDGYGPGFAAEAAAERARAAELAAAGGLDGPPDVSDLSYDGPV